MSIAWQCKALGISRSVAYYEKKHTVPEQDLVVLEHICSVSESGRATDLTYIKLPSGHVYLMAIIDLYSRRVLNWIITNTLDAPIFTNCLRVTIEQYGCPAIFKPDQGCQFTSDCWTSVLLEHVILISMDGKNRALDNIYVERLWRSLKYEDIYIKQYESVRGLRDGVARYFRFYNTERFHQSLDYRTP